MAAPRSEELLRHLCRKLAGVEASKDEDALFAYSLRLLSSHITPSVAQDELHVVDTIKKRLARHNKLKEAGKFSDLYHKLSQSEILKNKWATLLFLNEVSLDQATTASTQPAVDSILGVRPQGITSASSVVDDVKAQTLLPEEDRLHEYETRAQAQRQKLLTHQHSVEGEAETVSENILLNELLYTFQGIEGKYIKYDPVTDAYALSREVNAPRSTRDIVGKLAELGWLFRRVDNFVKQRLHSQATGLIGRALAGALHEELLDYFKLITLLESQVTVQSSSTQSDIYSDGATLTLKRLIVWTHDPLMRLQMLAIITDACKDSKEDLLPLLSLPSTNMATRI
eukprot:m.28196 g.28196  ORF g.28196 m.28196 type:complete len:341 (-) comp7981_c0_seq1:1617-2639(-)